MKNYFLRRSKMFQRALASCGARRAEMGREHTERLNALLREHTRELGALTETIAQLGQENTRLRTELEWAVHDDAERAQLAEENTRLRVAVERAAENIEHMWRNCEASAASSGSDREREWRMNAKAYAYETSAAMVRAALLATSDNTANRQPSLDVGDAIEGE